jgi:hypothetical protein
MIAAAQREIMNQTASARPSGAIVRRHKQHGGPVFRLDPIGQPSTID